MRQTTIFDQIGKIPMLMIKKLNPYYPKVKILAKAEYLNPGGSIKDRMVSYAVNRAISRGDLKTGMTIVEPTTGNTGASLAMIGALLGFRVILVVPKNTSPGKLKLMKQYGQGGVITSPWGDMLKRMLITVKFP